MISAGGGAVHCMCQALHRVSVAPAGTRALEPCGTAERSRADRFTSQVGPRASGRGAVESTLHTTLSSIARPHPMSLSVFEIFKIGIGPSSSHTMGPMNAARSFVDSLAAQDLLARTDSVTAELYGSLALTGRGHCTDRAILLGLEGMRPETIDSAQVEPTVERIRKNKKLRLRGEREIAFDEVRAAAVSPRQGTAGSLQRHAVHRPRCQGHSRSRTKSITAPAVASSSRPESRRIRPRNARRLPTNLIRRRNCSSTAPVTAWKSTS